MLREFRSPEPSDEKKKILEEQRLVSDDILYEKGADIGDDGKNGLRLEASEAGIEYASGLMEKDLEGKRAADKAKLDDIASKTEASLALTKDELLFLYEVNGTIGVVGEPKDPRIKALRDKRDPKKDAPIWFECSSKEIAWGGASEKVNKELISPETKVYVGPLFPGVFEFDQLEHLYTSFPEGRIERRAVELGGKTPEEYEKELVGQGHKASDLAKDFLSKINASKERHEVDLVRLTVADLGFTGMTRYDEIQERAKELGLDPAPAEVGPALRLALKNQPMHDMVIVSMEALTGYGGFPRVFGVGRDGGGS